MEHTVSVIAGIHMAQAEGWRLVGGRSWGGGGEDGVRNRRAPSLKRSMEKECHPKRRSRRGEG